jgi:glycosyltransferase involved in cell wall biosynthesis
MSAPALRVLLVAPSLSFGGLEKVVIDLARRLAASPEFGVEVCLLKREGARIAELADIPVTLLKKRPGKDLRLAVRLAAHIRGGSFNIVHAHGPLTYLHAALASRLAGVPCVYTEHARDWDSAGAAVRWSEWLAARLVARVVAVSEETRDKLTGLIGVAPSKVSVIINGVEGAFANGDRPRVRAEVRAELGLPETGPVVGFVGRLTPQKGPLFLIEAAALLQRRLPEARFIVIGDGESRPECERLAGELGIEGAVVFAGYRSDVSRLLAAFDLFVMPSVWEGTPLVLLEAMAAARPIVASSVGGIPQVVEDGESGLLIPPGDARTLAETMARALQEPGLAARLGEGALRRYRQSYSLDRMFQDYADLYRSCL